MARMLRHMRPRSKDLFSERAKYERNARLEKRTDTLDTEDLILNMGPQHPSTHGVLRLKVKTDGEVVKEVVPYLGYLHRGIEKNCEQKEYLQFFPIVDRADYLSSMFNNMICTQAVENLMDVQVPDRAQWIRVIVMEMNRIASHLFWWGTFLLDLGALTPFFYALRDREDVMDILELASGARLLYNYIRPGGVRSDVNPAFIKKSHEFVKKFPGYIDEYEELVTGNAIFVERVTGVGVISKERAVARGLSGPMLRGSGVNWDLRKNEPYGAYPKFKFDVPVEDGCDVMARYKVRMMEMRQSTRIIKQALDGLPEGDHTAKVPAILKPKAGVTYARIESPRGELGAYLVSDGTKKPVRFHLRAPSFVNLAAIDEMSRGHMIADLVAILGSVDIVLGDVDR